MGLLEHFQGKEIERLIELHSSYLRSGGLLIISVPTPTWLYRFTRSIAEALRKWDFPDELPIQKDALVLMMEQSGLQIRRVKIVWGQILTQVLVAAVTRPEEA